MTKRKGGTGPGAPSGQTREPARPREFTPAELLALYEAIIARPVKTRAQREAEAAGAPHEGEAGASVDPARE